MRTRRQTWEAEGLYGDRQRQAKELIIVYILDNSTCLMSGLRAHLIGQGFSAPSIYRAIRHLEETRTIIRKIDPKTKRIFVESLL